MKFLLLFLAYLLGYCHGDNGLTLTIYDNTARVPSANTHKSIIDTPSFTFNTTKPFSADIEGTISFNVSGVFQFNCSFGRTTLAFVWIDGHMVCQDGNAFLPAPGTMDNPLPIQGNDDGSPMKTLPFRAHIMWNGETAAPRCDPQTVKPGASLGCFNDTGHQCGFTNAGSFKDNSWAKSAQNCASHGFSIAGAEDSQGLEVWCGNKMPKCPALPDKACQEPCPGGGSGGCGGSWALRAFNLSCSYLPQNEFTSLEVLWSPWNGNKPEAAAAPIPTALLSPQLPPAEREREALQRGLSRGWGPWLHANMLALIQLPSAATVTTSFCKAVSDTGCITTAQPDGHKQNAASASVRVGHHAYDRSYVQYYLANSASDSLTGFNVSIEFSASGEDVELLVTPISGCSGIDLVLDLRFAWKMAGSVASDSQSLSLSGAGMSKTRLYTTSKGKATSNSQLRIDLSAGPVGFSTATGPSVTNIQANLKTSLDKEEALLKSTFGEAFWVHGMAVKGSIMWNLIWNPGENGAPLLPVSRDWNFAPTAGGADKDDFTYAIFDWDNIFASLLAGIGNKSIAYSNLIQVIKSKTAAGFVPNYAAGGAKSMDRTEPPVGAKALLDLYKRHGDKWMVELLFQDLLDWSNWFMRRRRLPPLDLIALGSFNEEADITGKFQSENMQAARFESGLDNSPMYDGEFYDGSNTFMMQLYDVGMSSMVVQESYALAELAEVIGLLTLTLTLTLTLSLILNLTLIGGDWED